MPFPPGWVASVGKGLPLPSGRRSLRFFGRGTATANFNDSAYNFAAQAGALSFPVSPVVAVGQPVPVQGLATPTGGQAAAPSAQAAPVTTQSSHTLRIANDDAGSAELEFSFDGVTVHGVVRAGEAVTYVDRFETGIAVRGDGVAFRVEAW